MLEPSQVDLPETPVGGPAGPYSARVRAAMLERLPGGEPQRYLYDLLPIYPRRAGKGVRSTLLVGTCAALGGQEARALPFGVAVELLHNAFLVHDDIQDGSRLRRGEPTLPVEYGTGLALCVGNALALEALAALRTAAAGGRVDERTVLGEVDRAVRRTLEGQAQELGWERDGRLDVSVADYLDMVLRKTAWYSVVLPCRLGALVAEGFVGPDRFLRFGALAGAVLQIADDIQSLLAPPSVTGKETGHDLVEGKRSLPIIHCLATGTELDRRRLERLLACHRTARDPGDMAWVYELLERTGSIDYARQSAAALAQAARAELSGELARAVSPEHAQVVEAVVDSFVAACG